MNTESKINKHKQLQRDTQTKDESMSIKGWRQTHIANLKC